MFERNCPTCNKIIVYKQECNKNKAEKAERLCKTCAMAKRRENPELIQKFRDKSSGKNNPMYGKTFYEVWVQKFGKEKADELQLEHSQKSKVPTEKNYFFGKSRYDIWKDQGLTEEEIAIKTLEWKQELSERNSGQNNPMFGKPSPKKSGNGWKGYYKGHFFRSLLELTYLVQLIDSHAAFESGESQIHKIEYELDGKSRNYFPDYYLTQQNLYVEIKPSSLVNSTQNKAKFESAKSKGKSLKIVTEKDLPKISVKQLQTLMEQGDLSLTESTLAKMQNFQDHQKG